MCGIFGIITRSDVELSTSDLEKVASLFLRYSQNRGQEAAGLAFYDGEQLRIQKGAMSGKAFAKSSQFRALFEGLQSKPEHPMVIFGHARLDTNSSKLLEEENSPLQCGDLVGVHNGIIVNVDELWEKYAALQRTKIVDSELLFTLLDHFAGERSDYIDATSRVYAEIKGSASFAALSQRDPVLVLASNTGSLFFANFAENAYIFASERYILQKVIRKARLHKKFGAHDEFQIRPGDGCLVDLSRFEVERYRFRDG